MSTATCPTCDSPHPLDCGHNELPDDQRTPDELVDALRLADMNAGNDRTMTELREAQAEVDRLKGLPLPDTLTTRNIHRRQAEIDRRTSRPMSETPDKPVVDLMAALEEGLSRAKAKRVTDTPTPISATDIGERIRQALAGTTPYRRHIGHRCHDMERHSVLGVHPLPVPCGGCFSIESLSRRVVFVDGSQRGFTIEGDSVDVVEDAPQLLADALAVIEAQERTIADLRRRLDDAEWPKGKWREVPM